MAEPVPPAQQHADGRPSGRDIDVFGMSHVGLVREDNQDHVKVAAAVDESFWTAQFDKHDPEHLATGPAPHGVFERWQFGRRVMGARLGLQRSVPWTGRLRRRLTSCK